MSLSKLISSIFLLCIVGTVQAQLVYEEDFQTTNYNLLGIIDYDGYTNLGNLTETWERAWVSRHFANAVVPSGNYAMRSITDPYPAVQGQQSDDWILLPQLTIPNNAKMVFEFCAESRLNVWDGYPELEVKISTTDTLPNSYTTIKTITVNTSHFRIETVDLATYAGQDVYIAIANRCYNPPYLGWKKIFVDNIQVGAFEDYDLQGFTFITEDWVKTGTAKTVKAAFVNRGNQTITSLDINYRVNNGSTVTAPITSLNIAPYDTVWINHPTAWTPSNDGSYTTEVWASNLNGNSDGNITNDTLIRQYEAYPNVVKKRPLLEIFGGANCNACSPLAADIDKFIDAWGFNSQYGHFSNIEYQTHATDPSDNADAAMRDSYYVVSGYPDEQISDIYDYKNLLFDVPLRTFYPLFDANLSMISAYPSFIDMDMEVTINGNTVTVTVDALPLKDFFESGTLHIAVCEKEYTYTGGGTSQTVFKHIMRKMLPDGNGTDVGTLQDGVPISVTESYTFTIGNVTEGSFNLWEGMDNIEVVAFIQNPTTEEVYQSVATNAHDLTTTENLSISYSGLEVFPVPADNRINISSGTKGEMNRLEVVNITGQVQLQKQLPLPTTNCTLNTGKLAAGVYLVNVFNAEQKLIGSQKFTIK